MFKPVTVQINNCYGFPVENYPFTIGVPWPEGAVSRQQDFRLIVNGQPKQFNAMTLANWSDGSAKWTLLDFQASMKANEHVLCELVSDGNSVDHAYDQAELVQIQLDESADGFLVNTGPAQFTIGKHSKWLFDQVIYNGNKLLSDMPCSVQLIDEQDDTATTVITAVTLRDAENALRQKINIKGLFQNTSKKKLADFNLSLTFYAGHSTVKSDFTLINSRAAEHPGGVWDLGDNGSLFFKELSIKIQLDDTDGSCQSLIRVSPDTDWKTANVSGFKLEQNSSGGKNWNSINHMNFKGEVPLEFKGFRYYEEDAQVLSGDRATPCVHLASGGKGVTAYIVDFWQNFPKGIQLDQSTLSLCLFPLNVSDCYELQGGERKRHTFYLDFGNNNSSLDSYINEIRPLIALDYYSRTKVIPWLPRFREDSEMQKLIDRGITGEKNFFDKREAIDEYGWRNFGEVFADHEELEYKGSGEFISHYNNQYDALYGFIKQYLVSGDGRWHELLSGLAQHIVDIDIYHTVEDRDEYNGGLFWHTHHYLNAFTCTHRTFSSKHAADFLYGEIGGGPGAEHCYTTGLSYYYFMTGDEVYKDAVLQLTNWVGRLLEGSGTVIERLLQFKSKELPILKRLVAGETVQRYSYPFTRGTGNYITSLIDAYNLTGDRQYLSTIERVIHQSIHPLDDIALRNLKDTEVSWSYLIYLQAVCKYLELKTNLNEIDDVCLYAKDSLLHYTDWMLENESPFLKAPENLEYPNHTWTAQDLRKANLFYIASLYSEDKKAEYIEAARFYVHYVEDTLKDEETRHYSRILILLMQNDIHECGLDYDAAMAIRNISHSAAYSPAPLYSVPGILIRFFSDIVSRVIRLSLKNERRWLSFRLK